MLAELRTDTPVCTKCYSSLMDTCENNADVYNKMIEPLQVLRQWSEAHKQEVLDAQDVYDTTA